MIYTPQYPNPTTNILSQPYASNGQYKWQMSGPIWYGNYLWLAVDGSGPQPYSAGIMRSADGKRWIAMDVANGPQNTENTAWFFDGVQTVTVCYSDLNNASSSAAQVTFQDFDLATQTWGAAYGASGSPTLTAGGQSIQSVWKRSDGSLVVVIAFDSAVTSTVAIYVYASGSWSSAIDLGANTGEVFSDAQITGCMDAAGDTIYFFLFGAGGYPLLFYQVFTSSNTTPNSTNAQYYEFPGQGSFPFAMDSYPGQVQGKPIVSGSLLILPVSMTRQDISPAHYIQVPSLYVLSGTTWTLIGSSTGVGIDPNVQTQTTNSPSSIPGFAYVQGTTLYVIYCGAASGGQPEGIIRLCTCLNFTNSNPNLWTWTSILANAIGSCAYVTAGSEGSFGFPCYGIANGMVMMTADVVQVIVDGLSYDATFWLGGLFVPPAWLLINEPPSGLVDRSTYLHWGDPPGGQGGDHTLGYSQVLRQRGQANVPLHIAAGDSYMPEVGWKVYLQDISPSGAAVIVFQGTIDSIQVSWWGNAGDRLIALTVVSLEQVLDAIEVTMPQYYVNLDADQIVVQLFLLFCLQTQISLGNIVTGATEVNQYCANNYERVSADLDGLATIAEYVWGVNPQDGTLYFYPPSTLPAPFEITAPQPVQQGGIAWEQLDILEERHDYRNRQYLNVGFGAFTDSNELFLGTGQSTFELLRPVDTVTGAWITANTQNNAEGTFSGQPAVGDTISINYPNQAGSQYAWAPSSPYQVGQVIIDPNNHIQVVTTVSGDDKSGSTEPTWNDDGGTTVDHNVIWQDQGPNSWANGGAGTYTFVETIDNTQWGQVLIGTGVTAAEALEQTVLNLIYAINEQIQANGLGATNNTGAPVKGVNFSLPTWENPLVNAYPVSNGVFKILNKVSGQGYIAGLTKSCANFSWNKPVTSGGSTPFGESGQTYGPISVGVSGQSLQGLVYTKGSNIVSLATPLNSGTNLQVQYQRYGGGVVAVEDTALVESRAVIEDGAGKYQMTGSAKQTATQAGQALLEAQQVLTAFDVIPETVTVQTASAGIQTGQEVIIAVTKPNGASGLLDGTWYSQEINARMVPIYGSLSLPQVIASFATVYVRSTYDYSIKVIDVAQIGTYLDFWESLGGGSGGGTGSVSGLGAGNGGALNSGTGETIQLETNGTPNVSQTTLNLIEGTGITLVNTGIGTTITGNGGSPELIIEVNGTPVSSETVLNLIAGTGMEITDAGGGQVTFASTGAAAGYYEPIMFGDQLLLTAEGDCMMIFRPFP